MINEQEPINEPRSLFFCQIEQFFRRTDGKDRKGDRFHSYTYSAGTSPKLVDMLRGPQLAALQQHRQSAKTQVSSCIRKPSQQVSFPFGEYRGSHGRAARERRRGKDLPPNRAFKSASCRSSLEMEILFAG